jgi:hypothetical protein
MAKTRRRQPITQEARNVRLEREWRQKLATAEKAAPSLPPTEPPTPAYVEQVRQEAEALVNAAPALPETDKAAATVPYSVQTGPQHGGVSVADAGALLWWNSMTIDDYIPVNEYHDPKRQQQLRTFALIAPFILNAISIMTKKAQGLEWSITAGRNLASKWQDRIANMGENWDLFIGRWVRAYCESDKPAYAELIRAAPRWAVDERGQLTLRGERAMERGDDAAWEIVDARVMDPLCVWPTSSDEFPVVYRNPFNGQRHQLRDYQFMKLTDMPMVDDRMPQWGVCAVSRAVWAAQEDRMVQRYVYEKLSDNPGAGIVLANVNPTMLETALKGATAQRDSRGLVYYKGVIFLPVLNPEGNTVLEYLNFSGAPENFNRTEVYNICKEVTATAFGLDVLEFGSIPAGGLGTGAQAEVASLKAKGKGMGALVSGIKREFRHKLLPDSVQFEIRALDEEQRKLQAEIEGKFFENAGAFVNLGRPDLGLQYLADREVIPDVYLPADMTGTETLEDTEAPELGKAYREPWVRVDRWGKMTALPVFAPVHAHAHEAEKQIERVQPPPGPPLPELDATITEADVDRANAAFDALFPEFAGLLDARTQ